MRPTWNWLLAASPVYITWDHTHTHSDTHTGGLDCERLLHYFTCIHLCTPNYELCARTQTPAFWWKHNLFCKGALKVFLTPRFTLPIISLAIFFFAFYRAFFFFLRGNQLFFSLISVPRWQNVQKISSTGASEVNILHIQGSLVWKSTKSYEYTSTHAGEGVYWAKLASVHSLKIMLLAVFQNSYKG